MSNLIKDASASSSLDCPKVDGRRQVQYVAARVAEVGGIPIHRVLPSRHRRLVGAWWNFVGHSKVEIAEAQREWEAGSERFGNIPDYDGERLMPPPVPWKV